MTRCSHYMSFAFVLCSACIHQAFATEVVLWRSVRTHGSSGAVSIPLDAAAGGGGSPTVEPRAGGIQRIEVDFDGSAALLPAPIVSVLGVSHDAAGNPLSPVSYTPSSYSMIDGDMTLQMDFDAGLLPDETCYRMDLSHAIALLTGDSDCYVRALVGDAGAGSGSVTLADVLAVKAGIGQPPLSNGVFDIIPGNSINLSDAIYVRTRIGNLVTCANLCPPPLADCNVGGPDGCEVNLNTDPGNCGACGNVCNSANATSACSEGACTIASCSGEFYDVNNSAANGCELLDTGGPHTQAAATSLGSHDCFDTPTASFNGTILSDSRAHPAVTGFDPAVGAAPDWRRTTATGGPFCTNDYSVTFTTTGGSAAACYKCTIMTNVETQFVIVNGTGSATMSSGAGSYNENSTIYFKVEKICGVASQEAVSYTISFHL